MVSASEQDNNPPRRFALYLTDDEAELVYSAVCNTRTFRMLVLKEQAPLHPTVEQRMNLWIEQSKRVEEAIVDGRMSILLPESCRSEGDA